MSTYESVGALGGQPPGATRPDTRKLARRHSEESVVKWAPQESRLLTSSWDEDCC